MFRLAFAFLFVFSFIPPPLQSSPRLEVLDRHGQPLAAPFTDGDLLTLRVAFDQPPASSVEVSFALDDSPAPLAACQVAAGASGCTATVSALGWYWAFDRGASLVPGQPARRSLRARLSTGEDLPAFPLAVRPRPVVLVHGFASNYQAWASYTGAQGYLASSGLSGFAVGDGQAPGVLNTGSLDAPLQRTNTLLENGAVLRDYIAGVKKTTGAQQVDLIVHSMGGMISRVYIDRFMGEGPDRDVAQLIILGSPALGTDCSALPAALGWYLPASLEIRSAYARDVLNPQFFHRKGVGFHALAGIPIVNPVGSPCTPVPNDGVIARESVGGIPLQLSEISLLHTALNTSPEAFRDFVLPLLQKSPDQFTPQPDPAPSATPAGQQFGRVFSGTIAPGGQAEVVIPIEAGVSVASFALFDPSLSLETTVIGASGNAIQLDPAKNGVLQIDDRASMVQLGYGFAQPKPGQWRVQLKSTDRTPTAGAPYALMARFEGGAEIEAALDAVVVPQGREVTLTARLQQGGAPLSVTSASARLRLPDGSETSLPLAPSGDTYIARYTPAAAGLVAIDVTLTGTAPDGLQVERTRFLALQVEDQRAVSGQAGKSNLIILALLCGAAALVALVVVGLIAARLLRRR